VIASIHAALTIVQEDTSRRGRLRRMASWFRKRLSSHQFSVGAGSSPIIPLIIGDNEKALRYSLMLKDRGIAAVAIRPPTVPAGTARIRFTVMATHTLSELKWAADQLNEIRTELEGERG
jgi:8-amino-7-oxononanoate synthase